MPISVDVPMSDGWWLRRLTRAMTERPPRPSSMVGDSRKADMGRREWMDLLWSYFIGEAPLPRASRGHATATQEFLRMARANYGSLAVEALMDRVTLRGVTTGSDNDADGDNAARRIHETNGAWLQDTLAYTFVLGRGFVIVGPGDVDSTALITAEDPRQVIAALDPARPHIARAALKLYRDDDMDVDVAHLFLPAGEGTNDRMRVAIKKGASIGSRFTPGAWEWDDERSGDLPVQGFGVPVVPFDNRLGMGEFEPHLDLLDRINNMIADRIWTSKIQAFRQRAVEGDLPEKDAQGQIIDYNKVFEADPGALWQLPEGVKMWESQVTDLQPILSSVRDDVREFSAVTRTPLAMFSPDGVNQSAAGSENQNDGLVFKGEDRIIRLDPSVLRVFRLGFAYSGLPDKANGVIQADWAPVRRMTLEQRGQAAIAGKNSGVPQESVLAELWQFAPDKVKRMLAQRAQDLFFAPVVAPQPTAPTAPGAAPPQPGPGNV